VKTQTHHPQTFRSVPTHSKPLDSARLEKLLQQQLDLYKTKLLSSGLEYQLAVQNIPLGAHSSFQSFEPYPISIASAKGAWMTDVDGRKMLDLSMGFGSMLVGHLNPEVVSEVRASLDVGTLYTSPSPISRDAAERLCRRFGIDQIRFTNSGTESTMYAVRTARAYTGKEGVVKVEGGYHGSGDALMVSTKPSLDKAGPADSPNSVIGNASVPGEFPLAAFGGKAEFMKPVSDGRMPHLGTFNGHIMAMAAVRAVDKVCTPEALEKAESLNIQALTRIQEIINEFELPAHTVGFGVKGCVTWSDKPVRNYRDYKATDFQIAELSFLWSLNHGIMTPPGLDEQWLISLAHGQEEVDFMVNDFRELAKTLRG